MDFETREVKYVHVAEWSEWLKNKDNRYPEGPSITLQLANTHIAFGVHKVQVSTVFGVRRFPCDGPPVEHAFETMIFYSDYCEDDSSRAYLTEAEAFRGHAEAVVAVYKKLSAALQQEETEK